VSAPVGPAAAFALLRRRSFGPYFLGNALSASGTWFQNLAAAVLVYRQTHSTLVLGVLNFCQFIPILVLAPWAGGAADRFNRRRLLFVTQSVACALAGGLGLLAHWGADRRRAELVRSGPRRRRSRWSTSGSRRRSGSTPSRI